MDEGHYCLSEVALFQDLSRREIAEMAAAAPRRTVPAGAVVYDPVRPVSVLFIVKSGRFRLYRILPDGRTVTMAVPAPGSVFGEMDLLGMRMGGTWAEALEAGDLCLMSRADVRGMLLGKSVVERTAHTLSVLAGPGSPGTVPESVRLTHGQLAALVGA
ncbi:MAG: Crp/Fnr family transcriptional regulator, partial [Actinomycetota bacterium]|nr:Crp/Fnr family transcriptional regulator [Actinomycetota bacterium]